MDWKLKQYTGRVINKQLSAEKVFYFESVDKKRNYRLPGKEDILYIPNDLGLARKVLKHINNI